MTKVTYEDPSEGGTWAGYHSIEIEEDGDLMASMHLAGMLGIDLSDPDELVELGRVLQQTGEQLRGLEL